MAVLTWIIVKRDNLPDIGFRGERRAQVSHTSPCNAENRTKLTLYETQSGKYICGKIQGKREKNFAGAICEDITQVKEFFGYGKLAKELYDLINIKAVMWVD